MAHVVDFTIDGLAGRSDSYHQKLNRDVNIFFGDNGSGKTSLLKILHSALSNDTDILRNVPFRSAKVRIYSIDHKCTFVRTLRNRPGNRPPQLDLHWEGGIANAVTYTAEGLRYVRNPGKSQFAWHTSPKKITGSYAHRYLPISRLYARLGGASSIKGVAGTADWEEELDLRFADAMERRWASYSAEVNRQITTEQQKGLSSVLRAVLARTRSRSAPAAADAAVAYRRVSQFLMRQRGFSNVLGPLTTFRKRYENDSQLRRIVQDIEHVETMIETANTPRKELEGLVREMFRKDKDIIFSDSGISISVRKEKIGLPNLSPGEKQLLLICVEALLAERNILMADEPEMSMHVEWQSKLVSSLRQLNSSSQLIFATHSPEIMADLPDNNIFRI